MVRVITARFVHVQQKLLIMECLRCRRELTRRDRETPEEQEERLRRNREYMHGVEGPQ